MATLILTDEFKKILEKQEVITALSNNGYNSADSFIKEILKRINGFDASLNLRTISYHTLQDTDTYIGIILDEYLNKLYNICVIPPILGTRSGFLSQQIFGFISNLVNGCKISNPLFLVDKPVIIVNCMVDSLADSAICNIIGAKIMGFNYIDIFNRKEDFGSSNLTLANFVNTISNYKDISKDIELTDNTLVLKTQRLKGFTTSLTNEPYYFAITAYPAVILAKKEGYKIDIDDFEDKFVDGKSNKNIKAFITFVKELKTVKFSTITSSKYLPYIAALRTKPFILLAGISGTGKSRIVREFAFKSCPQCLQDKAGTTPGNYCMIEVKPNWHDSTELLGYYSRLGNNPGYQFTKFVKFLVKAKMYPDVPFFVCLDEMNLAPVEQYFAEILSILETRKHPRNEGTGEVDMTMVKTEPIIDAQHFRELSEMSHTKNVQTGEPFSSNLTDREIYLKLFGIDTESDIDENVGNRTDLITKGLTLPDNVVIIGTVNMDDTTHQFSRKVIDRAMTIEMNGGNLRDMFGGSKNLEYFPKEKQKKWQEAFTRKYVTADEVLEAHSDVAEELIDKLPSRLEQINLALKGTPFEVSYRVLNELTIMVGVMLDEGKELDDAIAQSVNNILLMKILPRIEGDAEMFALSREYKAKMAVSYENRLEWLLALAPDMQEETADMSSEEGSDDEQPVKEHQQTAKEKIQEMIDRLNNQEFTRFWP